MNPQNMEASGYRSILTVSVVALLLGQVTSILGDRLNNIALIELISTETGRFADPGTTFELSKLALAMTLPAIALGPLAGAFVDRVNRKKVLITADVIRGMVVLAIPFMRPGLPLWSVYLCVAAIYLVNLFFLPARCAIVYEIVPKERLITANSLLGLGATIATIVGFGLGGIVASRAGWRIALFIDSATYFASAAAISMIKVLPGSSPVEMSKRPLLGRTIREALSLVRRRPGTRAGVLAPALLVTGGTVAYVLGVAILESTRREGTMVVGLLVSLAGLGMALGCYITGKIFRKASRQLVAAIGTPLAFTCLLALAFSDNLVLLGIAVALAGVAAGPVFVSSETVVQEETPARRQATVFALRDTMMKVALAGSALAAAASATALGYSPALVTLLGICFLGSLGVLARRPKGSRPKGSGLAF
jgi:predicted MFS family arabinose efflux permease